MSEKIKGKKAKRMYEKDFLEEISEDYKLMGGVLMPKGWKHENGSTPLIPLFINNIEYTMSQKLIFIALQSCSDAVKSPTQGELAYNLNTSIKTVSRTLSDLKEMGALLSFSKASELSGSLGNLYMLAPINEETGEFMNEKVLKYKHLEGIQIRVPE